MTTSLDVVRYLREQAAFAAKQADLLAGYGRIGADEAEWMEAPTREHAERLTALANAVAALDSAARAVFTAKGGRHRKQAICDLADLLGIETHRP
jgi:hypothetical protein